MNDPYPSDLEIEIDRVRLRRYYRIQAFLSWTVAPAFIGCMIGMASATESPREAYIDSWSEFVHRSLIGFGVGGAIGVALGTLGYFICHHFIARKMANALHVHVQGPCLRIQNGVFHRRDRKLHFAAIVDYACYQGPLMRWCGIKGISMNTTAGGMAATVNVMAAKDALRVRDMLSEIDRLREDKQD